MVAVGNAKARRIRSRSSFRRAALQDASRKGPQAHAHQRDTALDLLFDDGANGLDVLPSLASANLAHCRPRTVSNRQSLRIIRGDDARPLRDRVPGLERWRALGNISVPVQAARCL